jgi:hypothetical protein
MFLQNVRVNLQDYTALHPRIPTQTVHVSTLLVRLTTGDFLIVKFYHMLQKIYIDYSFIYQCLVSCIYYIVLKGKYIIYCKGSGCDLV